MPDNQVIDIQLQSSSPIIQMEIEKIVPQEPQVQLVEATQTIRASSSSYSVIGATGSRNIGFSSYVPEGYTCIGIRTARLANITGGSPFAGATQDSTVTYRNLSGSVVHPSGHDDTGYYYKAIATLICVKDGVLE